MRRRLSSTQKGDKGIAIGVTELSAKAKEALQGIRSAEQAFHNALCADMGVKPEGASIYRKGMVVSLPKIISARSDGAIRRELVW